MNFCIYDLLSGNGARPRQKQERKRERTRGKQRIHGVCQQKRYARLHGGVKERPRRAEFPRGRGDRRNTGRTGEHQHRKCGGGRQAHRRRKRIPVQKSEHARHILFGNEPRKRGERDAPVGNAHRVKQIPQPAAKDGEHALPAARTDIDEGKGEGQEHPHRKEKPRDHRYDLYYKLCERK